MFENIHTIALDLGTNFAILVGLIIGISQILKTTWVNSRWIPLITLVLGVGGSYLFSGVTNVSTIVGLLAGLSSMGLFTGVRATFK